MDLIQAYIKKGFVLKDNKTFPFEAMIWLQESKNIRDFMPIPSFDLSDQKRKRLYCCVYLKNKATAFTKNHKTYKEAVLDGLKQQIKYL